MPDYSVSIASPSSPPTNCLSCVSEAACDKEAGTEWRGSVQMDAQKMADERGQGSQGPIDAPDKSLV